MTIQENIAALNERLAAVQAHCMCAGFHDDGERYTVIYPPGMVIDGARAAYGECGKVAALDRLIGAMERHWKQSGIN